MPLILAPNMITTDPCIAHCDNMINRAYENASEFPNNKLPALSAYLGLTGFYKLPAVIYNYYRSSDHVISLYSVFTR